MRILYFTRGYTTHDRRFLEAIASRHETWFLPLESNGGYDDRPLPSGVALARWPEPLSKSASETPAGILPAFEQVLDQVRPDLVQAGPLQSCGYVTALSGAPFLAMSWGSDVLVDADRNADSLEITRLTLDRSAMLLCDCNAVREKVQRLTPYPDDRIVQFPWGVDLQEFEPGRDTLDLRARLNWHGAHIALSTRSWEQIYGHDVVLEAFRWAHTRNPRLRLILLGNGSLSESIVKFIHDHGLDHVIHRPGRVSYEKIPHYMRAADLYVSAAQSDGTSVSLVEAMATGLPVLVSNVPGNREWICSPDSGWLRSLDPELFGAAWLEAASLDAATTARIRVRNRGIAEQRADWTTNVGQLLHAYDRLASTPAMSSFGGRKS
jgi:glycosyltransferase involved in cell wall biosynthesis